MRKRLLGILVSVFASIAGCGGDGGGSGGPDGPRLGNASLSFSANPDFQHACRAAGFDAAYVLRANFSGDAVGGRLELLALFRPSGATNSVEHPIPTQDGVTVVVTGTDVLEFRDCLSAGTESTLHIEAWVVSGAGVEGNHVKVSLPLR